MVSFFKESLCVSPYLHKAGDEIAADPSTHCNSHKISSSEIVMDREHLCIAFFLMGRTISVSCASDS